MANIKGFIGAAGVAALASLALSSAAFADDEERKFGYSITLTGTSDYLFRGISLTSNDPAVQPFIEFTYGIAYLDFWGSNVKNGIGDPWELDIYAGIRPVTGPVSWDLGVLYYTNPDAHGAGDLDYVEFKVAASVTPFTNMTVSVTGYVTPDIGTYPETGTIEGAISYTLPEFGIFTPTIGGGIGYTSADSDFNAGGFFASGRNDYTYWNAGMKLAVDKYFMDFRYWDTDISDSELAGHLAGAKFVFSAGVNLP